jgi:hypothetical protein
MVAVVCIPLIFVIFFLLLPFVCLLHYILSLIALQESCGPRFCQNADLGLFFALAGLIRFGSRPEGMKPALCGRCSISPSFLLRRFPATIR